MTVVLTAREREVARLLAVGLSRAEAARRLGCRVDTLTGHAQATYRKLGIGGRYQLAAALLREGLIERDELVAALPDRPTSGR